MTLERKYLAFLAVVAFTAFMVNIPWERIGGESFVDRGVYLDYFLYRTNVLDYKESDDIIGYYTHEALWHYGMRELIDGYGIPVEVIFSTLSSLCIGVFAYYLVKKHHYWSIVFLINPLVIELAFSQLRIALALSLLGFAHFTRSRVVVAALIICSLFIHSAVIVFIFTYFSAYLATAVARKKAWSKLGLFATLIGIGLLAALIIGPLREAILGYLGDRRAEYGDMSSTFLFSSFWILLLTPMYMQSRDFLSKRDNAFVVSILALVAANVVFGGYSTRFLAAAFPMIISSMLSMRREVRSGVLPVFGIYAVIQWVYWLRYV